MNNVVGIDIGAQGALALLSPAGELVEVHDMPSFAMALPMSEGERAIAGEHLAPLAGVAKVEGQPVREALRIVRER